LGIIQQAGWSGPAGFVLLVLVTLTPVAALAECAEPADDTDVAVGIRNAPPFVTTDSIRGLSGLGVDLWRSIERDLQGRGLIDETELIECSLDDQLAALRAGRLDVVISPLTITGKRMESFDFSHQYLASGITVAQKSSSTINFGRAWEILGETVQQPGVPLSLLFFLLINMVLVVLVAIAIRSHVDFEVISHESRIMRGFRVVLETVARTTGLLDMSSEFRSTLSKTLDAVMSIIGILLSATIFGVLAAALIGSIGTSSRVSLSDLMEMRVVTLEGSTSKSFIEEMSRGWESDANVFTIVERADDDSGVARFTRRRTRRLLSSQGSSKTNSGYDLFGTISDVSNPLSCEPYAGADEEHQCVTTPSWREAMRLLEDGEVDAVLGDWAQLAYLSRLPAYKGRIDVQSEVFRNEPYGFGITPGRPELRKQIDRALLQRIRNPLWRGFMQQYLGGIAIGAN